jgi:hypothetical protein
MTAERVIVSASMSLFGKPEATVISMIKLEPWNKEKESRKVGSRKKKDDSICFSDP